jgi:hypothetical protein
MDNVHDITLQLAIFSTYPDIKPQNMEKVSTYYFFLIFSTITDIKSRQMENGKFIQNIPNKWLQICITLLGMNPVARLTRKAMCTVYLLPDMVSIDHAQKKCQKRSIPAL